MDILKGLKMKMKVEFNSKCDFVGGIDLLLNN